MTPESFVAKQGEEIGVSRWFKVTQAQIDAFADLTEDHQFIHIDPARAATTPFGSTVAHGFLTLSLLSAMSYDAVPVVTGAVSGVNYGFDRLRFLSPVRSDARLRGRFVLAMADTTKHGHITFHWDVTVEIEDEDTPALIARWINRTYLDATSKEEA